MDAWIVAFLVVLACGFFGVILWALLGSTE